MSRPHRLAAYLVLVFAAATPRIAGGCSCDGANPPCAAFWQADAVFIGTVLENASELVGGSLRWPVTKVAVAQTLRGSIEQFITLTPASRPSAELIEASRSQPESSMISSSCDYRFEVGHQYVVYASRTSDGRWITSRCSGTKPVEHAEADLEYIRTVPATGSAGRIYGTVQQTVFDSDKPGRVRDVPAGGLTVSIVSGETRLTTTTDSTGHIAIDVPSGEYVVTPILPDTVRVYGETRRVKVPARGCAPVAFSFIANGRVEGQIVRDDGTPAERVSIAVLPVALSRSSPEDLRELSLPQDTTDRNGRFSIEAILPGRYYLVVNARYGPQLDRPYATTYFPGVPDAAAAQAIELREGERKTGFRMIVKPITTTTVSGTVVSIDGEPVEGAVVFLKPYIGSTARSDASGAFHLQVLTGLTYIIGARTADGSREAEMVVTVEGATEGVRLTLRP